MTRSSMILVLLGCFGCYEETPPDEGTGGSGGSVAETFEEAPTSSSTGGPSGVPDQDEEAEGFDPCPEVTYVLWEAEGVKYYVTLEVFCEPIQNLNLGCPGPSLSN